MKQTQTAGARPRHNITVAALLCFVLLWLAYKYFQIVFTDGGDAWMTGDWLVNYAAGPVRRGAFGEAVRQLHLVGLPASWTLYAVQTGIYAAVFLIVLRLYLDQPRAKEWALLLLSPAFLLFPFYDLLGGFRKEILGFLAAALIALAATRPNLNRALMPLSAVIYFIAVFAHLINTFLLPYIIFFLYLSMRAGTLTRNGFYQWAAVFSATALLSLPVALGFPAGPEHSDAICASVLELGFQPGICDGAILWLQHNTGFVLDILRRLFPENILSYAIYIAVAAAPFFLVRYRNRTALVLASFLVMLPVYFIAIDWGRLIHISVFFLVLTLLTTARREDIRLRPLPWLAIILYLSVWSVPHCCKGFDFGLIGKLYSQTQPPSGN